MSRSGARGEMIDEAIEIATSRTQEAQRTVVDEIRVDGAPDGAAVDRVERRAEDLHGLARDAASSTRRPDPGSDENGDATR